LPRQSDFNVQHDRSDSAAAPSVQLHQQGRFDDAGALYRQVLAVSLRQFDALHLLA
jgi:hypothetical protein